MNFDSRIVVVSGGGGGIGSGVCAAFARLGANVVVLDADGAAASAVSEKINDNGGHSIAAGIDIADQAAVVELFNMIESRGGPDILVHAAAVNKLGRFLDYTIEDCERIVRTNFIGTFVICQAAARAMVRRGRGGRIINISSNTALRGYADRPIYGATKAATSHLTQTLAIELAPHSITVNAVAPGPIDTPMTAWQPENVRRAQAALLPIGRYGKVAEIVEPVLFLASDGASYITGHVLAVDGGYGGAGLIRPTKDE